jgi:hypothetical protein
MEPPAPPLPAPAPIKFNDALFNEMFKLEKGYAGKSDKIGDLINEANERMNIDLAQNKDIMPGREELDSYSKSLNNFTDADVYRYALNIYKTTRDVFLCGIDRTLTTICTNPPILLESGNPEDQRIIFVKTTLFLQFYHCLKSLEFKDKQIYRFFIRLLCLCDGFVVIKDILIRRFSGVIRLTTPSSSQSSSPEEPQTSGSSQQYRNINILQVSSSPQQQSRPPISYPPISYPPISLTSIFFHRFSDPNITLPNSEPFKIELNYDLQNLLNRPFYMLFPTLFEMGQYYRRGGNESLFTTAFKGFQYIGGNRGGKISKKNHRKSKRSKKSKKSKQSKSRRANKNKK